MDHLFQVDTRDGYGQEDKSFLSQDVQIELEVSAVELIKNMSLTLMDIQHFHSFQSWVSVFPSEQIEATMSCPLHYSNWHLHSSYPVQVW